MKNLVFMKIFAKTLLVLYSLVVTSISVYAGPLDSLVRVLEDEKSEINKKILAARALGELGDIRSSPALIDALKTKDKRLKVFIVNALIKMGKDAVPSLLEALDNNSKWSVRAGVAEALGGIKDKRAEELLLKKIKDQSKSVRYAAINALNNPEFDKDKLIAPLIEVAKSDSYYSNRNIAIAILSVSKDEKALKTIIELVNDQLPAVRFDAITALRNIGREEAVEPLIASLKDDVGMVQDAAKDALYTLKDKNSFGSLIDALQNENYLIRSNAVAVLGDIGREEAVEPLILLLKDGEEKVRIEAVIALGKLGDSRAVEPLSVLLNEFSNEVRLETVLALTEIDDASAVLPLSLALKDFNKMVRNHAITGLGRLGGPDALSAVCKSSEKDKDSSVRETAKEVCSELKEGTNKE